MTMPYDIAVPARNERGRWSDLGVHLRAADLSVAGMRTTPYYDRTTRGWGNDANGRMFVFGRKQPAYQWLDLDNDGVFETPAFAFYGDRTNLIPFAADLDQWTLQNSATRQEVSPLGALRLWRLTDANTSQGGLQSPTVPTANRFASGGNGAIRTFIAKGTTFPAAGHSITLRDVTNSADRGRITIDGWAGTSPSVVNGSGATILGQVLHGRNAEGHVVWEIIWRGSGTLTSADHALIYRAAHSATEQGDLIVGAAYLEDSAAWPMPFVFSPFNQVEPFARDEWRLPFAGWAGPCTFLLDMVEQGNVSNNGVRVVTIGDRAQGTPEVKIDVAAGVYRMVHHNGTSSVSSALTSVTMPVLGQRFQLYGIAFADGSVQLSMKIGSGAWVAAAASSALTYAITTGWSGYPTDSWIHFGHPYANRQSTLLLEGKVATSALTRDQISGAFG